MGQRGRETNDGTPGGGAQAQAGGEAVGRLEARARPSAAHASAAHARVAGEGVRADEAPGREAGSERAPPAAGGFDGPPRLAARATHAPRRVGGGLDGDAGYVDPLLKAADRIVDEVVELIREVAAIDAELRRVPDDVELEHRRVEAMREIHVLRAYSNYYRLIVARDEAYMRGERPPFRVVCLY
jgi:hypothetical protein